MTGATGGGNESWTKAIAYRKYIIVEGGIPPQENPLLFV